MPIDQNLFQMDSYDDLFPLDIASLPLLLRRALRGTIIAPLYSAVWRHFLITFPSSGKTICPPAQWISILTQSRDIFTKLQKENPNRAAQFRKLPFYADLVEYWGIMFTKITKSMRALQFERFAKIISYLVDDTATLPYVRSISPIVAQIFIQFSIESESREDDTPHSILLDDNFVLHDAYSASKFLISCFSNLFDPNPDLSDFSNQLIGLIITVHDDADISRIPPSIHQIADLYRSFFWRYLPERNDLLLVWTIIFSSVGDCTICHLLYSCIYLAGVEAVPDVPSLPMSLYGEKIMRWGVLVKSRSEGQRLITAADLVANCIELVERATEPTDRLVLRYQLKHAVRMARGIACAEELIPEDIVRERASEIYAR
jgi:hypothetical protein